MTNRAYRRVNAFEYDLVRILMILNIWWVGCKLYKNPLRSWRSVSKLVYNFKKMLGGKKLVRAFKSDFGYIWDVYHPAWPSKAFDRFFTSDLIEVDPVSGKNMGLRRVVVAITKRCPLNCEHCSEGESLNQKDLLSLEDYRGKINTLVNSGMAQIIYSGGEPLTRFDDLLQLITCFKSNCDQWLYTSAWGLTYDKAVQLKEAGLNGVAISLDHHLEETHNKFRANPKSFQWVMEGVKNLKATGLFVSFNVCPTQDYIESGTFEAYLELAKELDVPMVNILEPRAVGNYQGKDVELTKEQKNTLISVSEKFNYTRSLYDYPTVIYPAGFRRTNHCGGGRSYLFMDYDGSIYPCPFCRVKINSLPVKEKLCLAN